MTTALVGYYDYDSLRLRYRANAAPAALDAYVLYEEPGVPGKAYKDAVPSVTTFTTTWAEQTLEGDPAGGGGSGGPSGCNITGGGIYLRSSATSLVRGSLYARLVIARGNTAYEECLCCGYVYDSKPFLSVGEHADLEMSEAIAQMDVTYTQGNAAGGAVVVDIISSAGSAFEVLYGFVTNSGTNAIQIFPATSAEVRLGSVWKNVASGAATKAGFPSVLPSATASDGDGTPNLMLIVGTDELVIQQTGAGAQNDTFRISINIRVKGALPTVSKARSTNQADVTVTSGAASFAFIS